MKKGNYVMQGSSQTKGLDMYHLIVAASNDCNLQCPHCYMQRYIEQNAVLEKEEVLQLVRDFAEFCQKDGKPGIFHLKGGEPFMLPYLAEVLREIATTSLRSMITTNGTIINVAVIGQLKAQAGFVVVSLDGSTEEVNAKMRGVGNFTRAIEFVERITQEGISFDLNYVVCRENQADLGDFLSLAKMYGASQVNFLQMTGDSQEILSLEEYNQAIQARYDRQDSEGKRLMSGSLPDLGTRFGNVESSECVAGYIGLAYVLPNGVVWPCPNLPIQIGNVREESLLTIFGRAPFEVVKICGGCITHTIGVHPPKPSKLARDSFCFARNW